MCTGIKFDYPGGFVLGRTMDFEYPIDYSIIYLPRGYHFCDDLFGNKFITKYKIMGMTFNSHDPHKDAINEHGLMGITNDYSGFNLYNKDVVEGKTNISALDFMTYILGTYKTVKEIKDNLENIVISKKNSKGEKLLSPDFHFYFVDEFGDSLVVEPKKGKLIGKENPYEVITNSPELESHGKKLEKLIDINNLRDFNSAKNLPGGYDPTSRFIRSFYMTKTHVKAKSKKEALAFSYNILDAMSLPLGYLKNKTNGNYVYTRYISVYESKDRLLTVKTEKNPAIYSLSFHDIKNENEKLEVFLEKEFSSININAT